MQNLLAMKVLLALLFVCAVQSVPLDDCTRGPAAWCTSLRNAHKCGAVQHCKDTVWMNNKAYLQDASDTCSFCEDVVGQCKKMLTNNATVETIKSYLVAACSLCPTPDQCKTDINEYFDDIIDMIKSLDPKAVCATLGLCQGFQQDTTLQFTSPIPAVQEQEVPYVNDIVGVLPEKPATNDVLCDDCKKLITDIRDKLTNNETIDEIKALLQNELCSQLGPLESECDELVNQYAEELLEMLSQLVDPDQVCQVLGLCAGGDVTFLAKLKLKKSPLFKALAADTASSAVECVFCKTVFSELQELERSATVQNDVENFIKNELCDKLGNYKQECTDTVDVYGSIIFELLSNELDPATRCAGLGFCAQPSVARETSTNIMATIREAMPLVKANVKAIETKIKSTATCELCKLVVGQVVNMLADNATEQEIIAALDKACSILPTTLSQQCRDFVDMYGPAIIDILSQVLDPDVVCATLGLCSSTGAKPIIVAHKLPAQSSTTCEVCQVTIQYLDSLLEQNSTEAQIEALLEKVCNFMPSTFKDECNQFIETYIAELIQLVAEGMTPQQICTYLKLCSSSGVMLPFKAVLPVEIAQPVSQQLLGADECTWGPSYWCANEDNANKCGAKQHCVENVWNGAAPKN